MKETYTNELPDGWSKSTLGELGTWSSGGTPSRKEASFFGGVIPWIKTGDLSDGFIEDIEETITELGLEKSSAKVFPKSSLVVAMYGATIGKLGIINEPSATNQACAALLAQGLTKEVIPYVFYFLLKNRESLKKIGKGGAQPNISQTVIKNLYCPLPPLNEQRRIVAKIEELTDRTKKAREALADVPELIEQFRRSVLAAAFRGDLTADWREQNPDVEPAEVLLERIRTEKQKKLTGKRKFFQLSGFISIDILDIPECWGWIKFKDVITSFRSGSGEVPTDKVSNFPILRSSSVRKGKLNLQDTRYLSEDQSNNLDNFLEERDLLFTRLSGSLEYVANCAVVKGLKGIKVQYPDRLFCAKLVELIDPQFCEFWFASSVLRSEILNESKSSAGHQRISMGAIREAPFPLVPVEEQRKISEYVRQYFYTIDSIEKQYEELLTSLDQLDRAILAKAFRGELVPQDPTDEPASVLLDRIRSEREKRHRTQHRPHRP